jgi:uncharacterized protein (DUF427 family)
VSTHLRALLMGELDGLRHEPLQKRIRATLGDETVVDSTRALVVWEPKRVVPQYAVPEADVTAEIVAGAAGRADLADADAPRLAGRPVYDPSVPFAVHTTDGEPVTVRARATGREAPGFRPADADLDGHVILDFDGFDAWYEEDERNLAHPRDPYHRVDIVHSSRHVRIERDGEVLAESDRPYLLFESWLPVRSYLPREDVRADLVPSHRRTFCAYKGEASYWSVGGLGDIAWSYPAPLREAAEITDRIAFFDEHVDVTVDGVALERPVTPWSRR